MMRTPTPEQAEILQAAADGHDLIKVSALAGTGKTSTTEMMTGVPYRRGGKQLYSQFALAGGEDAAARLAGTGTVVLRPGQLAWRAAAPWQKKRLKEPRVKSATVAEAIEVTDKWVQDNTMHSTAASWVGSMRTTVVNFCQSADEVFLPKHLPPGVKNSEAQLMVSSAWWLWDKHLCGETGVVNYTQDHLKKHWSLRCPKYSYGRIMLDEAQDTNSCDLHVYTSQDTQLVVVGDPYQQLYEWRGAVNALSDNRFLAGGIWLQLTGSFRFGPEVAAEANRFLLMLGAPSPLEGRGRPGWVGPLNGTENAVLCRTNAECMMVALGVLRQGRSVALAGKTRDELLWLAREANRMQRGQRSEHPALINFRTWRDFCEYAEKT